MTNNNQTIEQWEKELHVAEDIAEAATTIVKAFLQEYDLLHEFAQHLYQIEEAPENDEEILAVASLMSDNMDTN